MTIQANIGGSWKATASFSVNVGGVWKAVDSAWVRVGGQWKQFYGTPAAPPPTSLDATMQVSSVSGSRSDAGTVTTSKAKILPTGGVPPYTYAWTRVSGATFTVNSPAAQETDFTTTLSNGESKTAVYRCTVTDSTPGTPLTVAREVNVNAVSSYVAPPPPFSVDVSPSYMEAERVGDGTVSTGAASATPRGGTPPYSYFWTGGLVNAATPFSQSCSFFLSIAKGTEVNASPTVRVTDALGAQGTGGLSVTLRAV